MYARPRDYDRLIRRNLGKITGRAANRRRWRGNSREISAVYFRKNSAISLPDYDYIFVSGGGGRGREERREGRHARDAVVIAVARPGAKNKYERAELARRAGILANTMKGIETNKLSRPSSRMRGYRDKRRTCKTKSKPPTRPGSGEKATGRGIRGKSIVIIPV